MNERGLALCNLVIEKCQQQRWYGGDKHNTARFRKQDNRYEEYVDKEGKLIVIDNDSDDHPRKSSFAYPPATEEQLLATEQALGFPLPSFLRTLYNRIANGGFGPGYGLLGACEGFDEAGNVVDMYHYHAECARLIDFEQYWGSRQSDRLLELPDTMWPRYMLYLCDWGEATVSCIDCASEKIFLLRLGEKRYTYIFEFQASSLQDWFDMWLLGKLPEIEREWDVVERNTFVNDDFDPFKDDDLWP